MITLMDKYTIIKLKQTGMSNRQVAKQLGLNRKTVNKYWNDYTTETKQLGTNETSIKAIQEKIVSKPKYDATNRKSHKYSEDIDNALDLILESEKEKLRLLGINKQQLSNVQIHQELLNLGFDIGKTTISKKTSFV